MKTAVILLAHGTREREASEPVFRYAEELARRSGRPVYACLREFVEPSLPTVVARLAAEGVERVILLPFFLFKSGHVTRDIAADLAAEKKKHPHLSFAVAEPIGYDEAVVAVLSKRLADVLPT